MLSLRSTTAKAPVPPIATPVCTLAGDLPHEVR